MKPYVYIIIRKDIDSSFYAPQIAHAALESGYQSEEPDIKTHIVILQVEDKRALEMVILSMIEDGIVFEEFFEGYKNLGLTAVATLPMAKPSYGCLCGLPLFKY